MAEKRKRGLPKTRAEAVPRVMELLKGLGNVEQLEVLIECRLLLHGDWLKTVNQAK